MSKSKGALVLVEFASYVDAPRFGASYCRSVSRQLLNSMPGDATADEKKAMKIVIELADEVAGVITERERLGGAKVRTAMVRFANGWSASAEILGGLARIEGSVGADAQAMLDTVFADGVAFVKLDAQAAWSEGQRRLDRIDDEGLARKLASLVGEHVVTEVREGTASVGEAIGAGSTPRELPSKTALADCVAAFGRGVGAYARLVASRVVETDPVSVHRFKSALAPIDEYRASRKGSTDDDEDAPEVVPVVTPVVTPVTPSPDAPINGV
jgi:hypothetical protein